MIGWLHWTFGSDRRDATGYTGHLVVIGGMQLNSLATISLISVTTKTTEIITGTGGLFDLLEYSAW